MEQPSPFAREQFRNLPERYLTELYRNEHIEFPLDPKEMVFFLDRTSKKEGKVPLRTLPYHHRSADIGASTIIHERVNSYHNVYCQFDIKGGGFLYPEEFESKKDSIKKGDLVGLPEAYIIPGSKEHTWKYNSLGLLDERLAQGIIDVNQKMVAAGMRTEGLAGVYRTKKIFLDGKEVWVKHFKEQTVARLKDQIKTDPEVKDNPEKKQEYLEMIKNINEEFDPVVLVRLMRSVFRLRDFKDADPKTAQAMVKEAAQNLTYEAKALGSQDTFEVDTPEGQEKWFKFISYWYGKNMGIMHGTGSVHNFLHMGNLTLAGEIVDLDSIFQVVARGTFTGRPEEKQQRIKDRGFNQEPFFHETPEGVAFVGHEAGLLRGPDERFGLPKCIVKDFRDICFGLRQVLKDIGGKLQLNKKINPQLAKEIITGYQEGLGSNDPFKEIDISNARLVQVFTEIAQEVVGQGKYFAPVVGEGQTDAP